MPFTITHKADNSDYESSLAVNVLKDVHMLSVAIRDNNGVNVVFCMDPKEMRDLADYIREAVK